MYKSYMNALFKNISYYKKNTLEFTVQKYL